MLKLQNATYLVKDLDHAIDFFVNGLGFIVRQDEFVNGSWRRVVVGPAAEGAGFVLGLAPEDSRAVGRQAGGDVAFFLEADNFGAQHARMVAWGIRFREEPRHEAYGTVAVFEDPFGQPWDLIGMP
jgi:catechol 2,3-dioxygenase-like lactoylglutathione lyase family enzyme